MHSHIAIIGTNGELALKPDTSLNVTDKNPMFNDVEMFTQTIPLPFDLNRRVLKNMDDVNSTMRSADVQGERFQFVLDGIPFRNAAIKIQEGVKLDGTIDVNFDATNRTFKDMIADLRCRDVTVDDDILIGEKIGDINFSFTSISVANIGEFIDRGESGVENVNTYYWISDSQKSYSKTFNPPALGFSYPAKCSNSASTFPTARRVKDYGDGMKVNVPTVIDSYINVSTPYSGGAKYCNSRICYAHKGYDKEKKESTSEIVTADKATYVNEDYSPYWVLDAERPASGICFYVGYFLERLFKTLGVAYDITALTNIEDFNYLAFFTTTCKFKTGPSQYSTLNSMNDINQWLSSRGCGGQLMFEMDKFGNIYEGWNIQQSMTEEQYEGWMERERQDDPEVWFVTRNTVVRSYSATAVIEKMYATNENFPDASVSDVIESLENAFGARFCYDAEINKVTVRLLRDMFRDQQAPVHFNGTVLKMVKMTENVRGVKMLYSAESDSQEQRDNVLYGKREYDTDYDYIDYPEDRIVANKTYPQIVEKVDVSDMSVYVVQATGNAIRIKVDKDATTAKEMKPTAFEVGQFKGIEEGDCSKEAEDEDAIKEIKIGFQPIVVNDVNFRNGGTTNPNYQPLLVPYIDEDMEHEFVEFKLQNPFIVDDTEIYFTYSMRLTESYDPSSTDDGSSPLMNHDWGLAVGILRTGDGGAGPENYDLNYDGFGNSKWRDIADNYCMSSDTMDQTGMWLGRTDKANTFSLKIRAWKPFVYYIDGQGKTHISKDVSLAGQVVEGNTNYQWLIPCNEDERNVQTGAITKRIRSRGLADVLMPEYIRFLLERQRYYVEALCTAAELADIPNKWLRRWEIDGKVGWINTLTYPIDVQTGLGKVEMEFFAL